MFFKKCKNLFLSFLLTLLVFPQMVFAYSDYVYVGGENIGIEVKCKGAMIVGTYKVNDVHPASEAGLDIGDIIIGVNGYDVNSSEELINKISNISSSSIDIKYLRNNTIYNTVLNLYETSEGLKTGIYIKDSISGIGTLTFIDPNTKLFGALGHEIIEKNTGQILNADDGKIFSSNVIGINPSSDGVPGEKNARYDSSIVFGKVYENTNKGIFGKYLENINSSNYLKVGEPSSIKKGKAYIRTVINDTDIEQFEINIEDIRYNQDVKNIYFKITDKNLIKQTGGIIQGMSGSPIIQNNMIIGAVTHMVVEEPTSGYGIFITNMLIEAEN